MAQSQPAASDPRNGQAGNKAAGQNDEAKARSQSVTDETGKPGSEPTDKNEADDGNNNPAAKTGGDPVAMLTADHRQVEQLFDKFEKTKDDTEKMQLAREVCTKLIVHTLLEEELFYPACEKHMDGRLLEEAQVEHDGTKTLINEVMRGRPGDNYFDAKVKVLSEMIKHHVQEEEKPREGILAKAKEAGIATAELAARLTARKRKLMEDATAGDLDPPATRSFRAQIFGSNAIQKETGMARGQHDTMDRERDDHGRFVSEDNDDRNYRSRQANRSRDDDGRDSTRSRSHHYDDDDRDRGRGPAEARGVYRA
jgi:hypothetical protein